MSKRILRTQPAADYIGVSQSSLEKWRLTGDGPAFGEQRLAVDQLGEVPDHSVVFVGLESGVEFLEDRVRGNHL